MTGLETVRVATCAKTRFGVIAAIEWEYASPQDAGALVFYVSGGDGLSARRRAVAWLAGCEAVSRARSIEFRDPSGLAS